MTLQKPCHVVHLPARNFTWGISKGHGNSISALLMPDVFRNICSSESTSLIWNEVLRGKTGYIHSQEHKWCRCLNTISTWMDAKSKQNIAYKLQTIDSIIGYDNWLTDKAKVDDFYASLRCDDGEDTFLTCLINAHSFNSKKQLSLLNKSPSLSDVEVKFFSINAFYFSPRNGLIVPQVNFIFPLFGRDLPATAIFSTIGLHIGHEIGHAVDQLV
ncbi:unnamed protein product [Soboliphyme baturini]|uniref:Peptidase_M13 domain-containing protein n=1 Tax=Soboliphyme baturini TaxID=241478 RepID=A0A183IPT6_9BILA|nr:unnamed protein product [Soboliphyme baturini]